MENKTILRGTRAGYTYSGEADLTVMSCPCCGITYAIPERLRANASERGNGKIQWYCPNGHQLGYHGASEADKHRRRAEEAQRRANAERDLREHTEHRLRAQKGATTKARKRHAAGVCPACNRTFSQLVAHMASQHPDYDPERGTSTKRNAGGGIGATVDDLGSGDGSA